MLTKADIQFVRSLADKRSRVECGLFVVEGRKMVEEALASGLTVRRVFGTEQYADMPGVEVAGEKEIGRMSSLRTPQGVMAVVEIPDSRLPRDVRGRLVLALDGVQDPGNLGTIIRTGDWFGVRDVVCSPSCADCYNPKVVQATMGSLFRVRVHYTDLTDFVGAAGGSGVPVFGTFLEGEDLFSAAIEPARGAVVVLGSEGSGISPEVSAALAAAGARRLFIPSFGGGGSPESLNVGIAAAVVCAEVRRRENRN